MYRALINLESASAGVETDVEERRAIKRSLSSKKHVAEHEFLEGFDQIRVCSECVLLAREKHNH